MHVQMTDEHITMTATFEELCSWDGQALAVYATPTQPDACVAAQVYVASRPQFTYDYRIADVQDFCAEEGWDTLGWEDMTENEMVAACEHTPPITISVSRRRSLQGEP